MKKQKQITSLFLAACVAVPLTLTAAGESRRVVTITVDGVPLQASTEAYITGDGVTMAPLRGLSEALGFEVAWDPDSRTVAIISGQKTEEGSATPVVVLDPGHGGSAPGAVYGGVQEKDLNLSIAHQAATLLERAGVKVLMTRIGDQDVGLSDRTDLAAGWGADLFVSVHCNASLDEPEAMGIYTAAYSEDSPSWELAEILRESMMEAAGAGDMGTEARPRLVVLRTAAMPAALVECGYMSTPAELEQLVKPEYQARIAQGIAEGVLSYLAADTSGPSEPSETPEPSEPSEPTQAPEE